MNSLRILITGASSGLGRALAEQSLDAGHTVILTARDPASVRSIEERHPDTAMSLRLDVTDLSSIDSVVAAGERRFGGIDVLINNAGYGYTAAVEEGEDSEIERLFATNFTGPLHLIQTVLPGMRMRRSGLIVNISSIGAKLTIAGGGYYSAAKAALEAASGSLRREVAEFGIHVMNIEPGSMRTDFRGRSARRSAVRISAYDEILGRVGDSKLGPQRGAPDKAAAVILSVIGQGEPPALLLLGSDAYVAYNDVARKEFREVERYKRLTLSTDAEA